MAYHPESGPVINAAAQWRDECLIEDGSILSDASLWTAENFTQLDRYFVQNLDEGEGSFFEKLEKQLEPASPAATQLAAEMFWVMYLMVAESAMVASTKRDQIRMVWGWSGSELSEDHPQLGNILAQGVAHPGTAYHTHRWREFRFFVTLMVDWKHLGVPERKKLLDDPWVLAEWLEEREHAHARQLRHILLFLLFPAYFERIATASHKRTIVKTFRKEWGEPVDAIDYKDRLALDREVLRVRERLQEEYGEPQEGVDFYEPPVHERWHVKKPKNQKRSAPIDLPDAEVAVERLQKDVGDGAVWAIGGGEGARLWKDFRDASIVAIGQDDLGDLAELTTKEDVHRLLSETTGRDNPTNDSLAAWQFAHEMAPGDLVIAKKGVSTLLGWGRVTGDYTYETDRAEYQHTRPVAWEDVGEWTLPSNLKVPAKTLTEISDHPVLVDWCLRTMRGEEDAPIPPDDTIEEYTLDDALDGLFIPKDDFRDILDTLARRKNVILQGPPGVGKTFMARRLAYALMGEKRPDRVEFVQFHQSYGYEDFVQGWRPTESGGFTLRDGVFHAFCQRAHEEPDAVHVFIVDEINRGNLSRIFGELMMLIEADKRGADHAIPLTYSPDARFSVPTNLHVIGLMNTADRSLAVVDYALRRRFGFIDLAPAFDTEGFAHFLRGADVPAEVVARIRDRMGELNAAIRDDIQTLGPGFEVGHSYFVPVEGSENRDDSWYRSIIRNEVAPLLREYWFDRPEEADRQVERLLA